jgi:SAM-dependent methyltransferase
MSQAHAIASAFDDLAGSYDRFTHGVIGRHFRAAVQQRLLARYQAGDRILEVNCGTGEDAIHLARRGMTVVATDLSEGMLAVARRNVHAAGIGVADRVTLRQLAIESVDARLGLFDGQLSNFGGLNCVTSLRAVAPRLAACVRPGGFALWCVMGPLAPWEWIWFLAQGRPAAAFRRLRTDGVDWRGVRVRYPSIRDTTRAASPWFVRRRVSAVGCLLPPTFAEHWARRHPLIITLLARAERRLDTLRLCAALSDHYLIELERTDVPVMPGDLA